MTKAGRLGLLGAASVALLLAWTGARASSPPDQYATFSDKEDPIRDNKTKLVWQRFVSPGYFTWLKAKEHCEGLTLDGGGFRLPTYKELLTLVDENYRPIFDPNGVDTRMYIDPNPFPDTPIGATFWTSTPAAGSSRYFGIDFGTGGSDTVSSGNSARVRCVK